MTFKNTVSTEEQLRSIVGFPSDLVQNKVITHLDHHCADFISQSPFLLMSTSDKSGFTDVSPRGDHPGFIKVLDQKHLLIPERPGNKRMDSLRNLLENPRVGLLFLIPGLGETLRVNGKAVIVKDEDLLAEMAVDGRKPLLGIGVEVDECFIHCAKALKRSHLWEPVTWASPETLPSAAKILFAHAKLPDTTIDSIEERLRESYLNRLY